MMYSAPVSNLLYLKYIHFTRDIRDTKIIRKQTNYKKRT
jgi:hypothetical protein